MQSVAEAEAPTLARTATQTIRLTPWPGTTPQSAPAIAVPSHDYLPSQDAVRRALNVAVALVALILVLPLMLVIAVAIKLSSPGPIFFKQVRVGIDRRTPGGPTNHRRKVDYGGRLFTMYKFRTMHHATGEQRQVWAQKEDPRIFKVGSFLRKYRLDELPQLINVVIGDMNMVGPRPEQPEIFQDLRQQIQRYPHRQRVLPGITGLAQVRQHYDTCLDDVRRKVAFDLEYIRRQSALQDLRIMAETVPSVLLRKNGW